MINRNKRDQEAWFREKTLESLKNNKYLQENDIVQVAEDGNFYKVVKTTTEIILQNSLYAQLMNNGLNAFSAEKLKTPRNIAISGDVVGNADFDGSKNINIITTVKNVDASIISTGTIDVGRLPKTALSDFIPVANQTARFLLTKGQVQNGDTVKETDTKKMFLVINDTKLNLEDGYQEYTTVVDWSTITGKPEWFPPAAHVHRKSEIIDFPTSMKNPNLLNINVNGTIQEYDGSIDTYIDITASSLNVYTQQETLSILENWRAEIAKQRDIEIKNVARTKLSMGSVSSEYDDAGKIEAKIKAAQETADTKLNNSQNSGYNGFLTGTAGVYTGGGNELNLSSSSDYIWINWRHMGNAKINKFYFADGSSTNSFNSTVKAGTFEAINAINCNGDIRGDRVYNAVWNDYAEFFERGEETEPGDIISLDINSDKERYVKASNENSIIVGVHSDSFAHLIGGEEPQNGENFFDYNIKKFIPIGLAGRVKVKVIGQVKKGDSIVISHDIPGVGISFNKNNFDYFSTIIGIALENKTSEGIGLVKILIKH